MYAFVMFTKRGPEIYRLLLLRTKMYSSQTHNTEGHNVLHKGSSSPILICPYVPKLFIKTSWPLVIYPLFKELLSEFLVF